MDRKTVQDNISKLIEKYERIKSAGKINSYNEAQTRNEFIEPLFEFLGWDMRNTHHDGEVTTEETISNKRVDLAFRIAGIPKMFLEAKSMKADLDVETYARQAINYSWNKGVTWAVLTDFESIKVFNSLAESKHLYDKMVFEISYSEFISDFDRLWLFSKESFKTNELDKYAEKYGKKIKRVTVNEKLFKDLKECRDLLTNKLGIMNEGVDRETLDEGVQKILDRLVFIRVLEDRELEEPILQALLHEWENSEREKTLFQMLVKKFRDLNDHYNSNLFTPHACEKWDDWVGIIGEVIKRLYAKETYGYDFKVIPADILGGVYESYLGYIEKSKEKSKTKRKSQGIYYTPNYVVEYIVKNTLGEKLKEVRSINELKKIKVLDPACGSGPFLTKSVEAINDKYKEFKNPGNQQTKSEILLSNIYGVDLDPQAIELARLNLLINALEEKAKLPNLAKNVEVGNSLISRGKRGQSPFDWSERFKEVFNQGGFDVVVGNPPYLKELDNKNVFEPIKKSEYKKYYQGKMDFWYFFLHRAMDVVKDNGYIGFITNSYFMQSAGASKLIERIKNELVLVKIVDFDDIRVFGDVSGKHIIHIYQKRRSSEDDKTNYIRVEKEGFFEIINENDKKEFKYQESITKDNKFYFEEANSPEFVNTIALGEIYNVSQGVVEATDKISKKAASVLESTDFKTGDGVFVLSKEEVEVLELGSEEKNALRKYLNTNNIKRYSINFTDEYLIYSDKDLRGKIKSGMYPNLKKHLNRMNSFITSSNGPYGLHRPREEKFFEEPKLICPGMFSYPCFSYDEEGFYVGFSFSVIVQKDKDYSLKYLLGVLNSSLAKQWFYSVGKKRGVGVDIGVLVFRQFPVFKAIKGQQLVIEKLVDQILKLNKELNLSVENTEKSEGLKQQIRKLDKKIDEEVYKLYGLSPEEIKIVEDSVK